MVDVNVFIDTLESVQSQNLLKEIYEQGKVRIKTINTQFVAL